MTVFLDGEEDTLLTVVNVCVILSPITVEDSASVVFLLAALARYGFNVADFERIFKQHLGEERYNQAFQEMSEAFRQYVNNRTMELDTGSKALSHENISAK